MPFAWNGPRIGERRSRSGTLLEARTVGELAQRAAVRVVSGAGRRPVRSLGGGVLADAGRGARPLARGTRALCSAVAGVEVVRVAVGLAVVGEGELYSAWKVNGVPEQSVMLVSAKPFAALAVMNPV